MKKIQIILLSAGIWAFSSCEKVLFEKDLASTDPQANFEYLWNECNEKYSYFELKNVDWEQVKIEYSQKLYPEMSEDSLFNVLGGMLKELRDDHVNLVSDFRTSFYGVEFQSRDNFDWRIIVDQYISPDYIISGPFSHNFIKNEEIGYVRLSTFSTEIKSENLDYIINRYKNTKGIILDIRENGGGAIANVFTILSRFVDSETLVYYSRIKAGPEQDNFSGISGAYVQPSTREKYLGKVVVLTDRGTYSSGSLLALASKALPNFTLLGDSTGGGLGIPNGGQLPNGWRYRFSVTQTLDLNQNPDFEAGVPADIEAQIDWNDMSKDEILEAALAEIL
ncbi:S41 family peptidase [bacterium]|nr:S41 family peptidase [bacterium]